MTQATACWRVTIRTLTQPLLKRSRYFIYAGGTQPAEENGLSYALSVQNPSQTLGGSIGVGCVIHFKGVSQQPGVNMMILNLSDIAAQGSFAMTIYGVSHTYQQLDALAPSQALAGNAQLDTNGRCAMRYD